MLNKKMEKELNKQVNAEFYSAYLYLSMGAYLESKNLPGFANWMNVQFQEEQAHGMKIFDYINERGGTVKLDKIDKPKSEWKDIVDVFKEVLKHEQDVTSLINNLVDLAISEKDHASNNMLQWFVQEQVEEEASAEDLLEKVKMIGSKGSGLFMLDKELSQRSFTPINEE